MAEIPQASKEGKLLVGGGRRCQWRLFSLELEISLVIIEVPPLGPGLWPSSSVLCLVERKGCQVVAIGPVWGTRRDKL